MVPINKVKEIITKHNSLEKELSSGRIDPKLFAKKSKEYSNLEGIIKIARKYVNFENEKKELVKMIQDKSNDQEIKQPVKENKKSKSELSAIEETESKPELVKKTQSSKFFSYLIVFIISLGALIILLDTLKTPLINIFPGLEVLLFNLYETLKDIKLFIIDLS